MPIRLTGMNSGLDTDSIVKALLSGYTYKKQKIEKEQTSLSWKQDAWKALNKKVYSLYTGISGLRYSDAYSLKKTTVSDMTKATVSASNDAINGSQKLNILQVAQSGYLTGAKLNSGVTGSTTLAELGYTGGTGRINIAFGDGTSKEIEVTQTTTVNGVIDALKNEGLNARFDEKNGRIFVASATTGKDADFSLLGANASGTAAIAALGLSTSLVTGTDADGNPIYSEAGQAYAAYAGLAGASTDDTRTNILNAVATYTDAASMAKAYQTQVSNLSAAVGYSAAYKAVQDFYTANGVSAAEQERFNSVMKIASSSRANTLVDASGTIYTKTSGKDSDGNEVYGYKDENDVTHYVAKEVRYSDGTTTYKKAANGEYVSVDDETVKYTGNTADLTESVKYYEVQETVTYTDADKNEYTYDAETDTYTRISDGVTFTKNEAGKYVGTVDGEEVTATISTKYDYDSSAHTEVAGMETVKSAYETYLSDYGISEEDATTFAKNLASVTSFEARVDEETALTGSAGYMSNEAIMQQVKDAYANGTEFNIGEVLTEKQEQLTQHQAIVDENKIVAGLAEKVGTDGYDAAVDAMVQQVEAAVNALANSSTAGGATKMDGQDAIITLNGVEFVSATNDISVNGITITAQGVTGAGDENAITITTNTDAQGIYDKIKDFLTEYNNIINEMNKLYNAASAKGYEPLTDEEKDEMSESEIEKWEAKIKDAILRNDSTLGGVISAMTSAMSKSYEIDGKTYSLSSFGISTLGYLNAAENENYAYHIAGDPDDDNTSGKTDKLMAAIEEDPDTLIDFMKQLSTGLYNALDKKMKSTTLSSTFTVYNDKQMKTDYDEYTELIKMWEERIAEKEEYYYQKFSNMESALASLNSTQSSLSGYFGGQ